MIPQKPFSDKPSDHEPLPVVSTAPLEDVQLADEYEEFGIWMNVQLSQLVAKWAPLAAPNARRAMVKDFGRRFAPPRKAK